MSVAYRDFFVTNLAEAHRKGQLVLFVGAGVSKAAGLPGLPDILNELSKHFYVYKGEGMDFTLYTQHCANEGQEASVKLCICNYLKDKMPTRHDLIDKIVKLNFRTIWSTNYDSLIEDCHKEKRRRLSPIKDERDLISARGTHAGVLYKIHGDIDSPADIVITKSDFENFNKPLMLSFLKRDLITLPFLFIGYSFDDNLILRQIAEIRKCMGGLLQKHYAIFKREKSKSTRVAPESGSEKLPDSTKTQPSGGDPVETVRCAINETIHAIGNAQRAIRKANDSANEAKAALNSIRPENPKHTTWLPDEENDPQTLFIKDLKYRYGIESLLVDHFDDIPQVLEEIYAESTAKNVFISGSFYQMDSKSFAFADELSAQLTRALLEEGYNIYTGIGKGLGALITGYAHEYLATHEISTYEANKRLVMRPYPFHLKLTESQKEEFRKHMQSDCSAAIFLFGQSKGTSEKKKYAKSSDLSDHYSEGVFQEFCIADAEHRLVIPVPETGYEASIIYTKMYTKSKRDTNRYSYFNFSEFSPERPYGYKTLSDEERARRIVRSIIKLLNEASQNRKVQI